MTIIFKNFSILVLAAMVTACVKIPAHDGVAQVPLDHIVKLVKCDIMKTIALKLDEQRATLKKGEVNKFAFLTQWAAKVHLTVQVDDTFGVNPGATLIYPKATAGTFFSIGAGAGLARRRSARKKSNSFSRSTKWARSSPGFTRSMGWQNMIIANQPMVSSSKVIWA